MNPAFQLLLPFIREGVEKVLTSGQNTVIDPGVAAHTIIEHIASQPEVVNQVNAEPLTQSRVAMGAGSSTIAMIAYLVLIVSSGDFPQNVINNPEPVVICVAALFGSLVALIGRVKQWKSPLRWFWS